MPIVKTETVVNLKGVEEKRVTRVGDGSIICLFNKTPPPTRPTDVVCPHFTELKWANGCYFRCSWCYLQGTYRFHPEWKNGKPNVKDYNLIKLHLNSLIESNAQPTILNAGELSDSLLTEHTKKPFTLFLSEIFSANHTKHRILFLTKSNRVENVLKANLQDYLIMSFTLNAFEIAKRWERGAPSVEKRIEAAKKVTEAKYETRVRIDPMVPVSGWKEQYIELVDRLFDAFTPSRITLGSLRGLQTTINEARDTSWVKYLSERSNWGKKVRLETRYEMYSTLIDYLKENYSYTDIALCKETVEIWRKLGLDYTNIRCNCIK
jgi:spore photoproduct lyase